MVRLLLCDDQEIVREGLETIFSTVDTIEVIGAARDGAEAIELVNALQPDIVLMDLKMPGMNGVTATQKIRALYPEVKVLILTTYDADEWVFDAIRSGASGYLLKDTPRDELIKAVLGTVSGEAFVDPAVTGKLMEIAAGASSAPDTRITDQLSEREIEVLRLLGRGLTNADIAGQLFLSEGTVRNYVSAILSKLDLADRTQAAILAIKSGLK
jgi:two-component system, NarL family, response regulator LiaR